MNQGAALQQALEFQLGEGWLALGRAAEAILNARHVTIASIGASYSASLPFLYRMQADGKRAGLVDASELLHYTHSLAGPGSVYILVSRSGETIEIVRLLEVLKGRGASIIGITNEAESPLARLADISLLLGSPRDNLIAIQTYSTTLLIFYLLAELVLGDPHLPDLKSSVEKQTGLVKSNLDEYSRTSKGWVNQFRPYGGINLHARGASRASANQATLLFHEMARFPASAWTVGEFRHGPWEVIDEQICAFVFMSNDQTQELNQAFAEDLAELGGQVHLISSTMLKSVPGNISILPVPEVDPFVAPLLEIIPLQFFIFEFSLWRGLTPGVFRASTPITLTEKGHLKKS